MLSKSHTKYITSLHHKKFREEHGVFIAEGPKVVGELLQQTKLHCVELFAVAEWLDDYKKLVENINTTQVADFELAKISALVQPNQVLAVFEQLPAQDLVDCRNKITLVLDGIQDPGNFGTIIRTADWFGISQILCSTDCADLYNPKVIQSTMGSLGRVDIQYVHLPEFLQKTAVLKLATTLDGVPVAEVFSKHKIDEAIIIIGNEGRGIRETVLNCADKKITIPRTGNAESLNAAVATGIILALIKHNG